ncbi:MAG TPA: hypothetical protein VFS21_07975, partial [Roseiflexaceae bacterium]|nr:hypothetical protein [Roseiflexaceae bacterium]
MSDMMRIMNFGDINIDDPFFDSLKESYSEFENWFHRKSQEKAHIMVDDHGSIIAFLYVKREEEELNDIEPPLPALPRLKVGTFKINPHGTRLGERFIKKIFDYAIYLGAAEIYVTIFPQHQALIHLFSKYRFAYVANKTTANGTEMVLVRNMLQIQGNIIGDYPFVQSRQANKYLLGIYPEYHTQLLPDSILNNESIESIRDVSHTNSIHKVYLCAMQGVDALQSGDILIIYRTSDQPGKARFRSVVTSLCVVEEVRTRSDFQGFAEYMQYCSDYSVYSEAELKKWFSNKNLTVIRFTYNAAFQKRITRGTLLDQVGLSADSYWGFMPLSDEQFHQIIQMGGI